MMSAVTQPQGPSTLSMEDEPFVSALRSLRGVRNGRMRVIQARLALLASAERRVRIEANGNWTSAWHKPGPLSNVSEFAVAHIWKHSRWEPSFRLRGLDVQWEGDLAVPLIGMGRVTHLRDDRHLRLGCPPLEGNERLIGEDGVEEAQVIAEYEWVWRRAQEAQRALREIDRPQALEAAKGSEALAWMLYLGNSLVSMEEWERARDRPGNALLWNYHQQLDTPAAPVAQHRSKQRPVTRRVRGAGLSSLTNKQRSKP